MKVSGAVLEYIKGEIEGLRFGKVTIEVVETSNKIDVITESRERFNKDCPENSEIYKKG